MAPLQRNTARLKPNFDPQFKGDQFFTLNGFAQVVSPPLFVDDRLINLPGGQVVVSGQPDVEEALIVPQI